LKVTNNKNTHHKGPAELEAQEHIRKLNWADVQIYDAMNKTFWKKMEQFKDDPTFAADLAELRAGRVRCSVLDLRLCGARGCSVILQSLV
jgi:hypothetical protein